MLPAIATAESTAAAQLPAPPRDRRLRERGAYAYRRLRRSAARRLHPWRRARAIRVVSKLRSPRGILVLCHGNICRSPFAAAVMRTLTSIPITSAGFIGPGRPVPVLAGETAVTRSIDLGAHRSQLVTSELLASADLVIVMDDSTARATRRLLGGTTRAVVLLGDLDPELPDSREIIDPWGRSAETFQRVFARIERCCRLLAQVVNGAAGAGMDR